MIDVHGKWALITGASRGIGKELSLFMAKKGCNLILHSRKIDNTKEIERLANELGVKTYTIAAELSSMDAIDKMLKYIDKLDIVVDFVFNNAGVQIAYRPKYFDTPVSDYTDSFIINSIAPMKICYHFLPKMIARGFGRIINTTSGIKNEPEQAGYSASKAALDKTTKDLGSKLVDGTVTINLVDPGWCRTDLGSQNAPNDVKSSLPGVALPAFMDDRVSGRIIHAQDYCGLSLDEAVLELQGY